MLLSARTATVFIAIALIGWGVIHFLAGDFIVGRAPSWPENIPGKLPVAYLSGALLIISAVLIVFLPNQKTGLLVTCLGIVILAWAGGRNLWIVLSNLDYGGTLTSFGKAITIGSGLLLVANAQKRSLLIFASVCTGIFFIIGGIQHFIFIDFVKTLVPQWIPGSMFWSYLAGVGLILSGIALITGFKRKLAAMVAAYMVFIWFLILHIPRGFGDTASLNEWIAVFESLFVAALLVVVYHREIAPSGR